MAREKLSAGIEEVNGATSPGHIHRVKRFRDARGRIIGVGVQETYNVSTLVTGKRNLPNGTKKRYIRFDAFVRTMIMQELKANQRK